MRKAKFTHFLMVALLLCFSISAWAQPSNDLCSGAIPVTCGDVVAGTTVGSTADGADFCGTSNTSPGVWYSFAGSGGDVTFSTCNDATYDTKISVYSGSCEGGLACVGGNDDATGCAGFTSSLTVTTVAGTDYLILVHGFGTANGTFNLTVDGTCGNNDACAGAAPIACGETVSGSTAEATFDDVGTCGTTNTGPGVWYTFTGVEGAATLSTCDQASYDTKISVFTGSCGALTCVGGNDDGSGCSGFSSELTVPTTAGTTYLVLVHGFLSAVGDFDLTLTCVESTGNDNCGDAELITCGETISGSTSGATPDGADFCGTSNTAPGVWYSYTATDDQLVRATTCSAGTTYDTKVSVYEGDCGSLVCVAGNDDDFACGNSILQSTAVWASTTGTTYLILVHGFGGGSGDFDLTLNCSPIASNDDFCDAIELELGVPTDFDNSGTTAEPGEVSPGAGTGASSCDSQDGWCSFETEVQNSVWFYFVAPVSGAVSVSVESLDYQVAVWQANFCTAYSNFTEVGANDDGGVGLSPFLELACLNPRETYWVQIDGFAGASGPGTVTVTDLGYEPLTCDAGGCQTKFVGYAPAEGLNHLIVTPSGGLPPYTYAWSGDGIVTDPNKAHISVDPTETTTYSVVVTDANGCTTECSVDVNFVDLACAPNKVQICHASRRGTNNLCVSENAIPAHLAHPGDYLGPCGNGCNSTNPPPAACVDLVVSITTDNFGSETSWEVKDPDGIVIASGAAGSLASATTTEVFNECVDPGCYDVTIFDAFGDGMCCGFGAGTYSVTYDGTTTASPSGGAFGSSETVSVGTCAVIRETAIVAEPVSHDQKLVTKVGVYPNPLTSSARIYVMPAKDGTAVIDILDINGRVIATLFNGTVHEGQSIEQEMRAELFGSNGVYLYRVQVAGESFVDKIIVNK